MKDVFLSHASQDKQALVVPFARQLDKAGISYWLDEAEIRWGDKISARISDGLARSRFIIVFLTPAFMGRNWTETELSAALTRENDEGRTVVLPIVSENPQVLLARYPLLRDKKFLTWTSDFDSIVAELQSLLAPSREPSSEPAHSNDDLTGVLNRQRMFEESARRIEDAKLRHRALAFLVLDIDALKAANDLLGHHCGDQILVEVAHRLTALIDEPGALGRLGSDEFLVVAEVPQREHVATIALRMLQAVSSPMTIGDHEYQITTSMGISLYPQHGLSAHELVRTAEIALYRCKAQSRGSFVTYDAGFDLPPGSAGLSASKD